MKFDEVTFNGVTYPRVKTFKFGNFIWDILNLPHCSVFVVERTGFCHPKYMGKPFNLFYIKVDGRKALLAHFEKHMSAETERGLRTYSMKPITVNIDKIRDKYTVNICKTAKYRKKGRIITI